LQARKAWLRAQGYEESIVESITAPPLMSSRRVYDYSWRLRVVWCQLKAINYFKDSMAYITSKFELFV
jgi:hypothetical protein